MEVAGPLQHIVQFSGFVNDLIGSHRSPRIEADRVHTFPRHLGDEALK